MPRRHHWDDLPAAVQREVERRTGGIIRVESIPDGASCELAVTLETVDRWLFCPVRLSRCGRSPAVGEDSSPPAWSRGDTLLHTDMTPRNLLLGDRLRLLVDWSAPCRGAAWIDTALMLVRLVRAGHSPVSAERWAARIPAFAEADAEAVIAFADALVRLWDRMQRTSPAPHRGPLLDAARRWREHRMTWQPSPA